jgi:hypothetical protein
MGEVGLFYLAGLVIAIPFMLVRDLRQLAQSHSLNWGRLSPIEQNLRRASHGAAYIVLPLAVLWRVGPDQVGAFLSGVAPGLRLLMIGACAVWFVFAFARLAYGWSRSAGVRDGLLAARAVVKLALGLFLIGWPPALPPGLIPPYLDPWVALALFLVALWFAVTGFMRFVLLVRPAGRALPEVEDDIATHEFDWDK